MQDGVVKAVILIIGLKDVSLCGGPRARVLREVDVRESQLPEVLPTFFLLQEKKRKESNKI